MCATIKEPLMRWIVAFFGFMIISFFFESGTTPYYISVFILFCIFKAMEGDPSAAGGSTHNPLSISPEATTEPVHEGQSAAISGEPVGHTNADEATMPIKP